MWQYNTDKHLVESRCIRETFTYETQFIDMYTKTLLIPAYPMRPFSFILTCVYIVFFCQILEGRERSLEGKCTDFFFKIYKL